MGTTVFERQRPAASVVQHSASPAPGTRSSGSTTFPSACARPALARGHARADLVVVGGGYTGLWTALLASERDPGARSCCSRRNASAGRPPAATAASARRASRTATRTGGALARRDAAARPAGPGEPRRDRGVRSPLRHGLPTSSAPASSPPRSSRTRSSGCAMGGRGRRRASSTSTQAEVQASVHSPTYLAAVWEKRRAAGWCTPPARRGARPRVRGARRGDLRALAGDAGSTRPARASWCATAAGRSRPPAPCWARTCSPRCSSATGS